MLAQDCFLGMLVWRKYLLFDEMGSVVEFFFLFSLDVDGGVAGFVVGVEFELLEEFVALGFVVWVGDVF